MNLNRAVFLCSAVGLALMLAGAAVADQIPEAVWDGGTANPGDWNDPINWDDTLGNNLLPGASDDVEIATGATNGLANATVNITSDVPAYADLRVATGAPGLSGTINHSAGTATAGGWVFLGVDNFDTAAVSVGTYNLSGTGVWNTANTFLGTGGGIDGVRTAEGYLNISDSAQLNTGSLNVGNNDDNYGEVNQTGGTVSVDNWFNVGDNTAGHGVYNMSGGSVSAGQISVGQAENATGEMHLSGNASLTQSDPTQGLRIGRGVIPDQTTLVFAEGLLSITGGGVNVSAANLSVGGDETGEFGALPTPTTTPAQGTLSFISDGGAVSPINVSGDVLLNNGSGAGFADLVVDFETSPLSGDVLLIDLSPTSSLTGAFRGLPEGTLVSGSGGRTISYMYGADSNDIALIGGGVLGDADGDGDVDGRDFLLLQRNDPGSIPDWESNYGTGVASAGAASAIPEPACAALLAIGLCLAATRRRS